MMWRLVALIWLGFVGLTSVTLAAEPKPSVLEEYVRKTDPVYGWKVAKTIDGGLSTTLIVELTSQSWLTESQVDRTVWKHWLIVVKPKKVVTQTAFLMIGGGANDRPMPEGADPMITTIAQQTGSVVAELKMVPNQPLVFHGDGKPRKEDDLIAYGWDQFLKNNDSNWLARLPMVKSATSAMDCLQELGKQHSTPIAKFVVAGASKRGWTTWMTAAVDSRVEAIVPIVIDVLNVDASMRHHVAVYGFWATAIGNYYEHRIMQRITDPKLLELYRVDDPFAYRERLKLPKFIVNASGDQFFVPDSSQFYFDQLPGEKLLRYVPNGDHSLRGTDALDSILAFYQLILQKKSRPQMSWTFESDGSIRVRSEQSPKQVLLWQATNPAARDFRLQTIGPGYASTELKPLADGSFEGRIASPEKGWSAFFIECAYDVGSFAPLKQSTAVRVLPDRKPFADLDPAKAPYEPLIKK